MKTMMVRYKARPECAAENEALIAKVYAARAKERPPGLRYQVLREKDGLGFVHLATRADTESNPLTQLAAFRQFVAGVKDRCEEPPVTLEMQVLGVFDSTEGPIASAG